jgi:microcystin-dependent protein
MFIGIGSGFPYNTQGGAASLNLTVGQLPPHTHSYNTFNSGSATGNANPHPDFTTTGATTGSTGSGDDIDIQNPYMTCYFIYRYA